MSDLGKRLARETDLDESLAETIMDTAIDYVKMQRPDLASGVDQLLASKRGVARLITWIARWGRRLDPR